MLPEDKSFCLFIRQLLEQLSSVSIDFFPLLLIQKTCTLSFFLSMSFAKISFLNFKTSSKLKNKNKKQSTFLIYNSFFLDQSEYTEHIILFFGKSCGPFCLLSNIPPDNTQIIYQHCAGG